MPRTHEELDQAPEEILDSPTPFTKSFLQSPLLKVRLWLVVAGVLLILFFGFRLPTARAWVEDQVRNEHLNLPKAQVDKSVLFEQWRAALCIGLALIWIVLGVLLKEQPMPIVVVCLT